MQPRTRRAWILLVGTLMLLSMGILFSWSVFIKPLEAEFHWERTQTLAVFAVSMLAFTIGNMVSGWLLRRHSFRQIAIMSAVVLCVGFLCTSGVHSLTQMYLGYGLICGIGIGVAYNIILPTVLQWFPDRSGMASGILLMGYGLGGFLLEPIITALLESSFGWRNVFHLFAVLIPGLLVLCTLLIRAPRSDEIAGFKATVRARGTADSSHAFIDVPTGQMLRSKGFLLFFVWMCLLGTVSLGSLGVGKTLSEEILAVVHGVTVANLPAGVSVFAAVVSGLASIGNGLGRLGSGPLLDNLGVKRLIPIVNGMYVVAITFMVCAQLVNNIVLLAIGYCLVGMSHGVIVVTMTFFVRAMFGDSQFALHFSLMNVYSIVASFAGTFGSGYLHTVYGSYLPMFWIMTCFVAVAIGFTVAVVRWVGSQESFDGSVVPDPVAVGTSPDA